MNSLTGSSTNVISITKEWEALCDRLATKPTEKAFAERMQAVTGIWDATLSIAGFSRHMRAQCCKIENVATVYGRDVLQVLASFHAILDCDSFDFLACKGFRRCEFIEAGRKQVVQFAEHDVIGVVPVRDACLVSMTSKR